jgi:hypothetical protein
VFVYIFCLYISFSFVLFYVLTCAMVEISSACTEVINGMECTNADVVVAQSAQVNAGSKVTARQQVTASLQAVTSL